MNIGSVDELEAFRLDIERVLKSPVVSIDAAGRDDLRRSLLVTLKDGSAVTLRTTVPSVPPAALESEVAALDLLRTRSSVPVPRVLYTNYFRTPELRPYILLEKINGKNLDGIWSTLASFQQDLLVGQIARWMMELFSLRFDVIGSPYPIADKPGEVRIGEIVKGTFYLDGRAEYPLDRGPFPSAKAYLSACAQRELDSSRFMFSQDTSVGYQQKVEDEKMNVERSMTLLQRLIDRCQGLDDLDPEMAPFSLDIHELPLRSMVVSVDDPTHIISVEFPVLATQALWACARIPPWLAPSMSGGEEEANKARLAGVFRQTIIGIEGYHSVFLRGVEAEDTRHSLLDMCKYDAFKDGFLLMPTLESIVATLPGEEDVDGLEALLDPSTLEGRVARIALMTRGPGAMSFAAEDGSPSPASHDLSSPAPSGSVGEPLLAIKGHLSQPGQQRAVSGSVLPKASNTPGRSVSSQHGQMPSVLVGATKAIDRSVSESHSFEDAQDFHKPVSHDSDQPFMSPKSSDKLTLSPSTKLVPEVSVLPGRASSAPPPADAEIEEEKIPAS